jgi:microbial collagenase
LKISSQEGTEESAPHAAPTAEPARADRQFSAAADECGDLPGVINATDSALIQQLKALPKVTCTYLLFNLTGKTAGAAFREAKMVTVADALRDTSGVATTP